MVTSVDDLMSTDAVLLISMGLLSALRQLRKFMVRLRTMLCVVFIPLRRCESKNGKGSKTGTWTNLVEWT